MYPYVIKVWPRIVKNTAENKTILQNFDLKGLFFFLENSIAYARSTLLCS